MAKKWVISAVFGALAAGIAGGCREPQNQAPAVTKLEQLRDKELPRFEKMTASEREASAAKVREQLGGVTKEQRQAFFETAAPLFAKALVRDADRILALPEEEQRKELDRKIDELRARNASRPKSSAPADPKRAEEMRKRMLSVVSEEDRQKLEAYQSKLVERLKERGLPPNTDIF